MYEFLNDEEWWKHLPQIDKALSEVEVTYLGTDDKERTYLPDISWEEVQAIKLPKTIVYNNDKPAFVIVMRKFASTCWIRIRS